ncbi:MAG: hypothetical protein M0D57_10685 [Sphingobacteriales bacterium JAD_PAG50586_3]|nr:MAG: hypothetical protein M0D57_10685 [Sphingobacteriales bacterium JAD_PAG50586_3]
MLIKPSKTLLPALAILILLGGCGNNSRIDEGNRMVDMVEQYKKQHHKLPESIADLGIREAIDGPTYYEKKDSVNYIIWFGTSLGESKIYYSSTKSWEDN